MRLVIDGRRLTATRTGVGRYLEGLLAEWAATGLPFPKTRVILKDPSGREMVPDAPGLSAEVVGERWPGLAWENLGLARRLRRGDLLFAPTNLLPVFRRGPTVLVLFDLIQEVLPDGFSWHVRWRFGPRYRAAARRADVVIVPSLATAHDAQVIYGVDPRKVRVIPPGPDPNFRPRPAGSPEVISALRSVGLRADEPYFLHVGKRSARRNVPALLDAFVRHRRRYPDHRLVFVGPGGDGGIDGREGVVAAGHVAESVLQGLMAGALALVYPSDYEGFGLPVVEALASGCPVITLRNSALTEAGGDAPYYLDSATPEALAGAMAEVVADPDARVARGLEHAAGLSRAAFAGRVKEILQRVGRGEDF